MSALSLSQEVLTKAFCQGANHPIIFHPETAHEAQFIADQFMALGFRYYQKEYADRMEVAVTGKIYLDNDKTIMVTKTRDEAERVYSTESFEELYVPNISADASLGATEVMTKNMIFYPRSLEEARNTLRILRYHGADFLTQEPPAANLAATCAVTQGIYVHAGKISFAPNSQAIAQSVLQSAADLGAKPSGTLSAEQITVMAVFNEMAARMSQMADKIERLEAEILPAKIEKTPNLPKALSLPAKKTM